MENDLKQYILDHFHYCDGVITRDDRKGGTGSLDKDGYLIIKVKGKQFKAHRIVWLLCNGEFPCSELDHINRNKTDNHIENLRIADRILQNRNKSHNPNSTTGVCGVYVDRCTDGLKKKYTTRLCHKTYRFYTLQEAINFRKEHGLWI